MAYLNFAEGETLQAPHAAPADRARFSALEWSVIAIARRDRLSSLRQPGRIAKAAASLFGIRHGSALADDRLEALRRIAVLAWHRGYALPVSELRAFRAAGFTNDHYEELQASIARGRPQTRGRGA